MSMASEQPTLIHKSSEDLWTVKVGEDGSYEVERLFDDKGRPTQTMSEEKTLPVILIGVDPIEAKGFNKVLVKRERIWSYSAMKELLMSTWKEKP